MKNGVGKMVGAALFAAGAAAIWLWPKEAAKEEAEEVVRPVRSIVVSDKMRFPELRFPGKVRAYTTRDLMFEVGGRLVGFDIVKGQHVKAGEVLAKLDARDFEADVKKAEAECKRAELTVQRMHKAAGKGGVSKEEVSKAEADAKSAEAQLAIAKKALESCVIKAPYDGVVADTYPQSLDMVSVGQKILTLQDMDKIKIDVSVPEIMVISRRFVETLGKRRNYVVFDSLPDHKFDVAFEEFVAQADDRTQTFTATFSMGAHEEFIFLPGMSVTLVFEGGEMKGADAEIPCAVPTSAVGADETGAHFVWKLVKADKDGEYKTVKQQIKTGPALGTTLSVMSGLKSGDRIAVAGVGVLTEGRVVTLYKE